MNANVTSYINDKTNWKKELEIIRIILLKLPLNEEIKWGIPAYIYKGKNILGFAAFKNYCGIWFHNGVFLKDEKKLLINAQENKTKAMRQMRFYNLEEIQPKIIENYVLEAIANSEAGKEIKPKRNAKPLIVPEILISVLSEDKELKEKFNNFTIAKRREFCEHISSAKKEATKQSRLDKIIPLILTGKGLHEKYKK
ncbi:YdeI/OmpD-associated family protein [Polaribacter sp. OB-PA-B3]